MLYFQIPIIKKDHAFCLRRRGKELCYFITFPKLIFYCTLLYSLLTLMVAGLVSLSYWLALVSPPPTLWALGCDRWPVVTTGAGWGPGHQSASQPIIGGQPHGHTGIVTPQHHQDRGRPRSGKWHLIVETSVTTILIATGFSCSHLIIAAARWK